MHYTEGQDYLNLGGGVREFVDQALPGTPGTVDPAEWSNAVQYEIINCITAAGIFPNLSAAADRASGFQQLRTAIFASAAINTAALRNGAVTDSKVNDVTLTKLTHGTASTTNANDNMQLSSSAFNLIDTSTNSALRLGNGNSGPAITFQRGTGVTYRQLTVANEGFNVYEPQGTSYMPKTLLTGKGLSFIDGPGSNDADEKRTDGYTATSFVWTIDPGTASIYTSPTNLTLTGIPDSATIYDLKLEFIDTTGRRVSADLSGAFIAATGADTILDFSTLLSRTDPTGGSGHILWVTYDATNVD